MLLWSGDIRWMYWLCVMLRFTAGQPRTLPDMSDNEEVVEEYEE